MTNPSLLCAIPDCGKPARYRALCVGHYRRFKLYGDPMAGRNEADQLEHLIEHLWDECPKWPFGRNSYGYGAISIKRKNYGVHNLVCRIVYGPPPTPEHEAAHNCGKGHEGCFGAMCLRWATAKENFDDRKLHGVDAKGERNPWSKLTEDDVRRIRALKGTMRHSAIAKKFSVTRGCVSSILRGASWKHLLPQEPNS